MEGAQSIGRTGAVLSMELSERPSGLDVTSRLEESFEGALEGDEVDSCAIADVCVCGDEETGRTATAGETTPLSFYF